MCHSVCRVCVFMCDCLNRKKYKTTTSPVQFLFKDPYCCMYSKFAFKPFILCVFGTRPPAYQANNFTIKDL